MTDKMLRTLSANASGPFAAGQCIDLSMRVPNATPAPLRNVRITWPQVPQLALIAIDGKPTRRRTTTALGFIEVGAVATCTARYEVLPLPADADIEYLSLAASVAIGDESASTNEVAVLVSRRARLVGRAGVDVAFDGVAKLTVEVENVGDGPAQDVAIRVQIPAGMRLSEEPSRLEIVGEWPPSVVRENREEGAVTVHAATFAGGAELRSVLELCLAQPCTISEVAFPAIAVSSASTSLNIAVPTARIPAADLSTSGMNIRESDGRLIVEAEIHNSGFAPARAPEVMLFVSGDVELALGSFRLVGPAGANLRADASRGKVVLKLPTIAGGETVSVAADAFRRRGDAGELRAEVRCASEIHAHLTRTIEQREVFDVRFRLLDFAVTGVLPGEVLHVAVEAWNAGTLPTSFAIEATGDFAVAPVVVDELVPGASTIVTLELVAPDAGKSDSDRLSSRIVATCGEDTVLIACPTLVSLARARIEGWIEIVGPAVVGRAVDVLCHVRNVGNANARDVVARLDAGEHSIEVLTAPCNLRVGDDAILRARLTLERDVPRPIVVRGVASFEATDRADILAPAAFLPLPSISIEGLTMEHAASATVGDLVPIKVSFRNEGESSVPRMVIRALLDRLSFVQGSLRVNGKAILGDARLVEGLLLEGLPAGSHLGLEFLVFAGVAGSVDPTFEIVIGEDIRHGCSAGSINVELPSAFALGSLALDAVALDYVEPLRLPAPAPMAIAPVDAVGDASVEARSQPPGQEEGDAEASAAHATEAMVASEEARDDVDESATRAIVLSEHHEEAHVDDLPAASAGDGTRLEDEDVPPIALSLPTPISVEDLDSYLPEIEEPMTIEATDGAAEDVQRELPPSSDAEEIAFAVELTQAKLVQVHKYLSAAETVAGDALLLHVLSLRPFLPTRILDVRGHMLEDSLTRMREKFEASFDGVLSRLSIDPKATIGMVDIESLSARSALMEVWRRLLVPSPVRPVQLSADRLWSVALVDQRVLRAAYASLEATSLGDAAALRAITMMAGSQLIGKGADGALERALSAYRESMLDVWALYEERPGFDEALRSPAPYDVGRRRRDLLDVIGSRVLVRP